MAYTVVRTDLMSGTDDRSQLVSIKYMGDDGATPTEIENGSIVKVGDLIEGEREVFTGITPDDDASMWDSVLIATPEVMYDERKKNLDEFTNEAGAICRGYRLHFNDVFSVTADGIDGTPTVGAKVYIVRGSTKIATDGGSSSYELLGRIIAEETVGRYTYYSILVTVN